MVSTSCTVEYLGLVVFPLGDVQHAHDDCGVAGPLISLGGSVNFAVVLADPAKAGGAGVALGDGVGGDEAQGASIPHQVVGAPVEVGHEVRVAVTLVVQGLQPDGVAGDVAGRDGVLAGKWGVPDERIETGVLAVEDFGELDLPVERGEGWIGVALLLQPGEVADGLALPRPRW